MVLLKLQFVTIKVYGKESTKRIGKNVVALKFIYDKAEQDTINLDQTIIQHLFYVKK